MKRGKTNSREWRFGMNAHVGTDRRGLVHTPVTTHAGAADISQLPQLLRGEEHELYGDQVHWSAMHRVAAQTQGARYRVNRRPAPGPRLTEHQRRRNRLRSANPLCGCSSSCGATGRSATVASQRTRRGCSRCLRSPSCIWRDDACWRDGRGVHVERRKPQNDAKSPAKSLAMALGTCKAWEVAYGAPHGHCVGDHYVGLTMSLRVGAEALSDRSAVYSVGRGLVSRVPSSTGTRSQ